MDDSISCASTAIPVQEDTRREERARRAAGQSRGVSSATLAKGRAASEAISAANARADTYQHELDSTRVRLGRCEDAIREFQRQTQNGAAPTSSIGIPPDPITAELLKRDANVTRWTDAYQRLAEVSALERAERKSERAASDAEIQRLERRVERLARERDDRDRRASPDPELATARRERDAARRERDEARSKLSDAAIVARNDINYYINKAHNHRTAELDARNQCLELRQRLLALQARLQQAGGHTGSPTPEAPPIPPLASHFVAVEPGILDEFGDVDFSDLCAGSPAAPRSASASANGSRASSPSQHFRQRSPPSPSDSGSCSSRPRRA